jgi:hypothetical protein
LEDYGKGTGLTHAVAGIDLDVTTGETVSDIDAARALAITTGIVPG